VPDFGPPLGSPAVTEPISDERWQRLAELAVHGTNLQADQVLTVSAEIGQEKLARAVAVAAYARGARFVDVFYFDAWLKRARIENADPETLAFVPPWYGERLLTHAAARGARISFSGRVETDALDGLDPWLLGRDRLPFLKETTEVIAQRTTNWSIVPCPSPEWGELAYPELPPDEAYRRLWRDLEHVLRLDEPAPAHAWEARLAELEDAADRLTARRFDAIELRGPGTELTVGMLPSHRWLAASFTRVDGLKFIPNLPTEEVFTSPDPQRVEGHVTSTKPLVLFDGATVRGLRVRFENGVAVEIDAEENADALRARLAVDEGGLRLGEIALVDRRGRIGPLETVFYDTLLDENAASHLALGSGFPFAVDEADVGRINESGAHVDFMVGSLELDVDGVDADRNRVPVLRSGDWQI
jgi:aminopeptidase